MAKMIRCIIIVLVVLTHFTTFIATFPFAPPLLRNPWSVSLGSRRGRLHQNHHHDNHHRSYWRDARRSMACLAVRHLGGEEHDEQPPQNTQNRMPTTVQVYDDAFSPVACQVLHCLSILHSLKKSGEETTIFFRPPHNVTSLTLLEQALDSALTALQDNSSHYVEYWSRQEYMNMDAHVDIDEAAAATSFHDSNNHNLDCPTASHVLYLQLDAPPPHRLVGPTCVFPQQTVRWTKNDPNGMDLVTIPAVQGRLLRFPGNAMHAVPCPPHRWLLTEHEEQLLRMQEEEEDDDDDDDDCDDDDDDADDDDADDDEEEEEEEMERSVLLFNTWSNDAGPGISRGKSDSTPKGHGEGSVEDELEVEHVEHIRCNPISRWRQQTVNVNAINVPQSTTETASSEQVVRISLMGEQNRRGVPESTVRLTTDSNHFLRAALEEERKVTVTRLYPPQS